MNAAIAPPETALPPSALEERFNTFHREHPEVFERLRELALQARRAGITRYAIATLYERVRWHFEIVERRKDLKLNNSHRSFYSRMLMAEVPALAGFFETRQLHSERSGK